MFNKKIHIIWYAVSDWCAAALAWLLFYGIRKKLLHETEALQQWLQDATLLKALLILPFCWLLLYYLSGSYHSLYKKSRLNEAIKLMIQTVVGVLILFFALVLDDKVNNYHYYFKALLLLFALHFTSTLLLRSVLLTYAKWQINTNRFFYKTLLIDDAVATNKLVTANTKDIKWTPNKIVGYIATSQRDINLPYLGTVAALPNIVATTQFDEVIIGTSKNATQKELISSLLGNNLSIKLLPNEIDLITGAVKTTNILGSNLIEVKNVAMPEWQQNIKRLVDILLALFLLIVLSPVLLFVWLRTKLSTTASAIYTQQRLGYHGKPFTLYKFTSMKADAEANGIQLSSETDTRITPWGKIMRKWRLDELPQLWNILKGDMSFVGPRPERKFYAEQLIKQNSYYKLLYEMKPGLTSWGMVKFGYAENIEQMLERMQYDFVYANNASLLLDFKIMLHTLRIIFLGKGK